MGPLNMMSDLKKKRMKTAPNEKKGQKKKADGSSPHKKKNTHGRFSNVFFALTTTTRKSPISLPQVDGALCYVCICALRSEVNERGNRKNAESVAPQRDNFKRKKNTKKKEGLLEVKRVSETSVFSQSARRTATQLNHTLRKSNQCLKKKRRPISVLLPSGFRTAERTCFSKALLLFFFPPLLSF